MRRWILCLVVIAGCNEVYDLEETGTFDDDRDDDGVVDSADNCLEDDNPTQRDIDDDSVGDVCDNCPLIANRDQQSSGDSDSVGDMCDPHPEEDGDCLIVVDVLTNPSDFGAHWDVTGAPMITTHTDHSVMLTPTSATAFLFARDDSGARFTGGPFDVQVRGAATLVTGAVFAISNATTTGSGSYCGVGLNPTLIPPRIDAFVRGIGSGAGVNTWADLSDDPANPRLLMRLVSPVPSAPMAIGCRVDYGGAITAIMPSIARADPAEGHPGIEIEVDAFTLEGAAIYRQQSGTCPAPIRR